MCFFALEDVQEENKTEMLTVGAQVTFVYEPGTDEMATDDVQLTV